jgi:sarcosine oxidase gamma subunit
MELRLRGMEIDVSALKCRLSSPEPAIAAVNSTCALAGFSLLGQHWPKVLHRVTSFDVENHLPSGMCAQTNIAGIRALLVRADELQVPSIRIYVACDLAEYVWERLLAAENISLIGLDAWRNLLSGEAASGGC